MTTILRDDTQLTSPARAEGDDLWLPAGDLEATTGFTLKPEGFCQGDICVPVPAARADRFVRASEVNVAELWRHMGNPVVHDDGGSAWVLGRGAAERSQSLRGTPAPDFTLPDLAGRLTSLGSLRGKKVFLATWASW